MATIKFDIRKFNPFMSTLEKYEQKRRKGAIKEEPIKKETDDSPIYFAMDIYTTPAHELKEEVNYSSPTALTCLRGESL